MNKPDYSRLANHQRPKTTESEEPTFTLSVDDTGPKWTPVITPAAEAITKETRSDAPAKSPFSPEEIEKMRRFPVVAEQMQRHRAQDLIAHHKFMRARGPEIEKAVGVTAEQLFRRGDSAAAAKLNRENPAAYRFLREYLNYC